MPRNLRYRFAGCKWIDIGMTERRLLSSGREYLAFHSFYFRDRSQNSVIDQNRLGESLIRASIDAKSLRSVFKYFLDAFEVVMMPAKRALILPFGRFPVFGKRPLVDP